MNKYKFLSVLSIVIAALLSSSAQAEEGMHHEHPTHVIGLFLGATDEDKGSTEFTFGGEYEYRLNQYFGVGGVVERTPDGHHGDGVTVALGALHVHPMGALRLTGGIGREMVDGHEDETLYRLGAAYDFELANSFALAPTVNVDFVDGKENFVFGAVLSRHF